MRVIFGTSSGGQIQNTSDPVLAAEFHAREGNSGPVYVGTSTVSSNAGRELQPGDTLKLDFTGAMKESNGSVLISVFYVTGGQVDWVCIIR